MISKFFSGISMYIYVAIAVIIIGLSGACWLLIERNGTLKGNLKIAKQANKEWEQKLKQVKTQIMEEQKIRNTLAIQLKDARKEADEYKSKFSKHDLETLAKVKPGLVSRRMQSGTSSVLHDLEASINRNPNLPRRTDPRPNSPVTTSTTDNSNKGKTVGDLLDSTLRKSIKEPSRISESNTTTE